MYSVCDVLDPGEPAGIYSKSNRRMFFKYYDNFMDNNPISKTDLQ